MKKLLAYFFISAVVFTFSCKDDEEVDCDSNEDKIESLFDDYEDADDNFDCEGMEEAADKIVSLIRKSKSCGFVKDAIEDGGYDDVEDLIDEFEADVADDLVDAGC